MVEKEKPSEIFFYEPKEDFQLSSSMFSLVLHNNVMTLNTETVSVVLFLFLTILIPRAQLYVPIKFFHSDMARLYEGVLSPS